MGQEGGRSSVGHTLIQASLLPHTDHLGPEGIAVNLSIATGAYVTVGPELGAEE